MRHRGIKPYRFGQETGIDNGGVQRIQAGDNVGIQLVEKVAKRYGYDFLDLLSEDFNPAVMPRRKPDERWHQLLRAWPNLTPHQRKQVADLASSMSDGNLDQKQGPT